MPHPSQESTPAERAALEKSGVTLLRRDDVPGLVLPEGLQVADALLYLPDGTTVHVSKVPIPPQLCHLDVDPGGVAVPFVSAAGKEQADRRRRRCIVDGLCGVCGFELGYWKCWHIAAKTEDDARATRVAFVPPVHPDVCSAYAAEAYPSVDDLPLWGYEARTYRQRVTTEGQLVAQMAPAKRLTRLR